MLSQRVAVVIPGRAFGPYAPQLFFPAFAALRRGAEPATVEWQSPEEVDGLASSEIVAWVTSQTAKTLDQVQSAEAVVIAKSLGTYAAADIAERGLPAIWVTPVLTASAVVEGLRKSTAPFLLVGGTGDRLWDSRIARSLTPHVVEFPEADHGLFVPGPLGLSARNITRLAEASEAFLDEFVWPIDSDSGT